MEDRELLEAAAKAAGLCYESPVGEIGLGGLWLLQEDELRWWNPLIKQSDLYRYARDRGLTVEFGSIGCALNQETRMRYWFCDYPSEAHAILMAGLK